MAFLSPARTRNTRMLARAALWKIKSLPGEAIPCCFFNRVAMLAASGGANAGSTALPVTPQEHSWERGPREKAGAGKRSEAEAGEPSHSGQAAASSAHRNGAGAAWTDGYS